MAPAAHPADSRVAVVFDVDGVLVASPHERAWKEALRDLMERVWRETRPSRYAPEAFTSAVYQEHVAGKPRLGGARAVLEYFDVPERDRRAIEYAAHKQAVIERLIDEGAFVAFPDGVRLVLELRARGVPLAAASSSKNANRFMRAIPLARFAPGDTGDAASAPRETLRKTLLDAFDANVCGHDVAHGKPHPDLFLLAADALHVPPPACVVVEDAPSGVQAAKAGGMSAIGVARLDDQDLLRAADADLVVTSLDEVAVDALASGHVARTEPHGGGR